ncbi:hypothetical protein CR970_03295 [Candidatus Saccharibacteria bacterium]|nr:MAG: hypothetical protein CR970_03295 [Candidatus Saccharibacteria bacterium]
MSKAQYQLKRLLFGATAVSLMAAAVAPVLLPGQKVQAAGQVANRSIQMSTSKPHVAGDPSVTYKVRFDVASTDDIAGIVVEFCDNNPVIGDPNCTTANIPDFNVGTTVSGQSANIASLTTVNALTSHTLALSNAAAASGFSIGDTVEFDIDGVTNTSNANQTFYARIYTYGSQVGATGYTVADPNAGAPFIDYGGIAMSTGAEITITAKVQEQLSFCVYTQANCGAGGTDVTLGDSEGVLSNYALTYADASTKFDIATNAQYGAVVNLKMDTLQSGANSIPAQGNTCTADSSNTSVEHFGLRISSVSSAPLQAVAPYDCAANNHTLDTANTLSTYGQTIANTTGSPLEETTGTVEFAAKASLTTPAGIYTTLANFIATGTF